MQMIIGRLLIACGVTLGFWLSPAWAFTTDGQENICAQPWVIFCENFETYTPGPVSQRYRPCTTCDVLMPGHFQNTVGWITSDCYYTGPLDSGGTFPGCGGSVYPGGSLSIDTGQHFDGSKSFMFTFNPDDGASGMNSPTGPNFTAVPEIYVRYYVQWSSNFVHSTVGEKAFYVGVPSFNHDILCGDEPVQYNCVAQIATPEINRRSDPSIQSARTLGVWHCMELHFRMNSTPSSSDGLYEEWLDGVQYSNYPNANLSNVDTTLSSVNPDGYWNCAIPQQGSLCPSGSHPLMYRWYDNIVVGTQRVGCLPTPTGGATPPAAPTSLAVR